MAFEPANQASPLTSLNKTSEIVKDPVYFMDMIVFRVEDTLFQVPRYHFTENSVFSTIFSLSPPTGKDTEGSSESNPFELKGIKQSDFQAFLSILYPLKVPHNAYKDITLESWKSVLLLSTMWDFQAVRELAIQTLTRSTTLLLDPTTKITFGRLFDVPEWFIGGCATFVVSEKGPRPSDIRALGEEIATRIYDLREEFVRAEARGFGYGWAPGSHGISNGIGFGSSGTTTLVKEKVARAFEDIIGRNWGEIGRTSSSRSETQGDAYWQFTSMR